MAGNKLPADMRSVICGGWEKLNDWGTFGKVTAERMERAVSSYEQGATATDEFTAFVHELCEEMKDHKEIWESLGAPLESPSGRSARPRWRRWFRRGD